MQRFDSNNNPVFLPHVGDKVIRSGFEFVVSKVVERHEEGMIADIVLRGDSGKVQICYYTYIAYVEATDKIKDAELAEDIEVTEKVLAKTSKRSFKRTVTKIIETYEHRLAVLQASITARIKGGNMYNLNASHDRTYRLEEFIGDLHRYQNRGQYLPTYEETQFNGWID